MRILLLTDGIYPYVIGGMQKHSYYLAKYFAQNKIKVELHHCVGYNEKQPTGLKEFTKDELSYITNICYFFPKPSIYPGHYLRESYQYSKAIFENIEARLSEFDFIYAKGFCAWELLKEKKHLVCPPIGINFHGYEMYQYAPNFKVKLEHLLLRNAVKFNTMNADFVFSYGGKISTIIKELGVNKSNIIEIPTGIQENWLRPISTLKTSLKPVKFVFIGRQERRKGIEELTFIITELLNNTNVHFEFHFIGPIIEQNKIKNKHIIYHGLITEEEKKKEILNDMDILILPSYSEGMPNVILEGMARGLAIVATDVGAVENLIDNSNGWLIKAGDSNELKKTIINISNSDNKVLLNKKKMSIQKIEDKFLWKDIIQSLIKQISNSI